MNTSFVTAPDGVRIAYDITGAGPTLLLLHGGGYTRQSWHAVGYVERLKHAFRVITLDIRGNGESDKPTDRAFYTTAKHTQDILAVADACDAEHFSIWGFSYGGNIGRYLAAESNRVAKLIIMGIPFGLGASGEFRQWIERFREHWQPILQAQQAGVLDLATLSEDDQEDLQTNEQPLRMAWLTAMLNWRAIEPMDLRCPTLWLSGSNNENTLADIRAYGEALQGTKVQVAIVDGLNHPQEFSEIEQVLPVMLAFTQSSSF